MAKQERASWQRDAELSRMEKVGSQRRVISQPAGRKKA